MALIQIRARYEALKTLGFAAIGANFVGMVDMGGNPSSVEHPVRFYHILNNTNADLLFSWDGINPFVLIPAGDTYTDDICTNQALTAGFLLPEGSRLYIKDNGAAPTSGSIYLTVCYGSEQ